MWSSVGAATCEGQIIDFCANSNGEEEEEAKIAKIRGSASSLLAQLSFECSAGGRPRVELELIQLHGRWAFSREYFLFAHHCIWAPGDSARLAARRLKWPLTAPTGGPQWASRGGGKLIRSARLRLENFAQLRCGFHRTRCPARALHFFLSRMETWPSRRLIGLPPAILLAPFLSNFALRGGQCPSGADKGVIFPHRGSGGQRIGERARGSSYASCGRARCRRPLVWRRRRRRRQKGPDEKMRNEKCKLDCSPRQRVENNWPRLVLQRPSPLSPAARWPRRAPSWTSFSQTGAQSLSNLRSINCCAPPVVVAVIRVRAAQTIANSLCILHPLPRAACHQRRPFVPAARARLQLGNQLSVGEKEAKAKNRIVLA